MRAISLKTNHLTAPVGIDAGPLFLSWQCADGVRQTAYEIELTANGETVWHSGKVQSAAMHADVPAVDGSACAGAGAFACGMKTVPPARGVRHTLKQAWRKATGRVNG